MTSVKKILEITLEDIVSVFDSFKGNNADLLDESWLIDIEFEFFNEIKGIIDKINKASFTEVDFDKLFSLIDSVTEENSNKLQLNILSFKKKLQLVRVVFDETQYTELLHFNPDEYKILDSTEKIPFTSFEHVDANHTKCLFYFNFELIEWDAENIVNSVGSGLLTTFIYLIYKDKESLEGQKIMVSKAAKTDGVDLSAKTATSTAKLISIMKGGEVNSSIVSSRKVNYPFSADIQIGSEYQQFNDVLYILGEYNATKELLGKYLCAYHVIENFMYRYPIAKLSHEKENNEMFGIREFKRLYKSTDLNEYKALDELFKSSFKITVGGQTVEKQILNYYKDLNKLPQFDSTEYHEFTKKLTINKNYEKNLPIDQIKSIFLGLLYQTRCSIVHNKETEYHLDNSKISKTIHIILDDFLMKSMELIIFTLISTKNQVVWYKNKNLELYSV